jgi:hypothetical protein
MTAGRIAVVISFEYDFRSPEETIFFFFKMVTNKTTKAKAKMVSVTRSAVKINESLL